MLPGVDRSGRDGIDAKRSHERRSWALAGLAFGVVAPIAYIAQRLIDHAMVPDADPLSMLRQTHVAYLWRAATAALWGGLAGVTVLLIGADRLRIPEPRASARAVAVVAALFLVLAWIYP